ncbi:MAG TPA: hypothetical protein VEJ47_13330 [Candidatus Eremiobacteraceae bacterium]|nr:hypothetical protein [Candidatus Eremiobacteraceae bacterium]
MFTAAVPRLEVCAEYQRLLFTCQKALAACQQHETLAHRTAGGLLGASPLERLRREYAEAYALLERHEQACQTCQYISQVGGLDFEGMCKAINR